jgi:hypothetical protein
MAGFEVITEAQQAKLTTTDIAKDMVNPEIVFLSMLRAKLEDEIIARLSELAESKIGRLTFHFAAVKLGKLNTDVKAFGGFITREKFQQKRNQDISHKELPEKWPTQGPIFIKYPVVLRGVAHALRLMKRIDRIVLGSAAKYLWPEMRKRRYQLMNPASAVYMLLPHLNLSPAIRGKVIVEEMAEGREVWSDMPATLNGAHVTVSACQPWGAFLLGGRMTVLDHYPLQSLDIKIPAAEVPPADGEPADAPELITEERTITAKYRVTKKDGDNSLSFAPVRRVHQLEAGSVTELTDIHLNLNEQLKQDFGEMNIGDEKEFTLTVRIVTGFRPSQNGPADAAT